MTIRQKIVVDRALGALVAFPMNFFVRLIGIIANVDHSLEGEKTRIAICKYKGMGSIIQSTPLIQTLKLKYPDAKIVYVSSIENKAILEQIDIIDELQLIDDRKVFRLLTSSIALIWKMWRRRPDLYIDLEIYSNFSSIITTASMAKDRFGYYLRSSKYRMGMYTHMMYFNSTAPITHAYLQFARLLKCDEVITSQYQFNGAIEKQDYQGAIVINVNASDLRLERRWPINNFIELIKGIRESYVNQKIVLIGSKNEVEYVEQVSKCFIEDSMVEDVSGKTSLEELIGVIKACDLVITNDTGPMHLSSALRKPTLALFGPCSPSQYAVGDHIVPIYQNLYCSPCVHEFIVPPCKGDNQCMKTISVNRVLSKLEELKSGKNQSSKGVEVRYQGEGELTLGKVVR